MGEGIEAFFSALQDRIDLDKTVGINATIQFLISGEGGGAWRVSFVDGKPDVRPGTGEEGSLTVSAAARDMSDVLSGKLTPQAAFLTGRVKIQGDVTLAILLPTLLRLL